MTSRKEMSGIIENLEFASKRIEAIIADYLEDYADYGWDNFTETLANVSAQLYMQTIICRNATVKKDRYV